DARDRDQDRALAPARAPAPGRGGLAAVEEQERRSPQGRGRAERPEGREGGLVMTPAPPTPREQALVRRALHVVDRCATNVSRTFHGLAKPRELQAVGTFALYRAARTYRDELKVEFVDYAFRRVRDAMLKAVRAETFQARIRRAAIRSADALAAQTGVDTWNS